MQGTDIPVLEAPTLLLLHVHLRGVRVRSTCVILIECSNLLEREWPINDIELLRFSGSITVLKM